MATDLALLANPTREQVDLIKRTVCKGATDDELALFLHACRQTGLDPFMRQIYAVKRYDSAARREVMSVQVGIDGLRLVAERTGNYAPGREPSYEYNPARTDETLVSATAWIRKRTADGTWHEVGATARYDEYVQRTREGKPTRFWQTMPHVMLAKVAETLALRRAFPMELSGIYSTEEMAQADKDGEAAPAVPEPPPDPRRLSERRAEGFIARGDPAASVAVQQYLAPLPASDREPGQDDDLIVAEPEIDPNEIPIAEVESRQLYALIRQTIRAQKGMDDTGRVPEAWLKAAKVAIVEWMGRTLGLEHFHDIPQGKITMVRRAIPDILANVEYPA